VARFTLTIPPGVYRNGTQYQSKGRYYDAYCTRWYGSALGPIGGWRARSTDKPTGKARTALAWKTNDGTTYLGIATESHLYVSNRAGSLFDITPSGFVTGHADASGTGGFGTGAFGTGAFGVARPDSSLVTDATMGSLDTWGEDLLFVSPDDGKIYEWALNTSVVAAAVTNAPTCKALVVTAEGFVFALATTDKRTVSWCDQRNNTTWTPSTTNQAGNQPLQTNGRLMCGRRVRDATLVFTDLDVWLAQYIGGVAVYGFQQIGDSCGAISRGCVASFDQQAAWFSPSGFWMYNGSIQPLECDVLDYLKSDINWLQISKIVAVHNSAFFEIEWRYCSGSSTEIDRCIVWNYKYNYWTIGRAARTCGIDAGVFRYPILIGSDGTIYEHEVGFNYDVTPYAETGPIQIGNGDNVVHVCSLIPDEKTSGDVTATFFLRFNPNGDETQYGPFNLSQITDTRFVAREARVRFTGQRLADWRMGEPSLEGELGGLR